MKRRYARGVLQSLVIVGVACLQFGFAHAQQGDVKAYPSKPIRLIVPFPPGGSNDIIGRFIGQRLTSRLGRQVVIDNRAGADSAIGTAVASNSAPDGYTLLVASITYTMLPATGKSLPYDPLKSLAPVAMLGKGPNLFATWPGVPVSSIKELIALAKAKPGQLRYASSSTGGNHHFATELFKLMAGVDMVQVPYKGGGPAMTDVIAGHVEVSVSTLISAIPHVRSARLKPLGVSSLARAAILPDVPTVHEAGVPGYEGSIWWGILAPARTPVAIVAKLNAEINAILQEPETIKSMATQAAEPWVMSPQAFGKQISDDIAKWTKVAKASGIDVLVRQ